MQQDTGDTRDTVDMAASRIAVLNKDGGTVAVLWCSWEEVQQLSLQERGQRLVANGCSETRRQL